MKTHLFVVFSLLFASTAAAQQSVYHSALVLNLSGRPLNLGNRALERPPQGGFLQNLLLSQQQVSYNALPHGRGKHLYVRTQFGVDAPYVEVVLGNQARQIVLNTHVERGVSYAHLYYIDSQLNLNPMQVDVVTALNQDPALRRSVSFNLLRTVEEEQQRLIEPQYPPYARNSAAFYNSLPQ